MARRQALSTAQGKKWYVGTEIRDSISALDVLYANQFEEMSFDSQHLETEENFYRGAPPKWLNFHISDQAEPNGTGTYIVERDECSALVQEIHRRRNRPGTSVIKLYHEPGSGGTTVAMQVLWKLRKTFRCAALKDSTPGIESIAEEVVCLYTAGGRGRQNTVLLLLDEEEPMSESLRDSIMTTASEQDIVPRMPVVIVLSCVRKAAVLQSDHFGLKRALSNTEKQRFSERNEWLRRRFGEKTKEFHGFNIMQTDFSQAYVEQACNVFSTVKRANKPPKTQLAAFLSLLNAYVPGSYLLESQCRDILKHNNFIQGPFSLKDKVQPFSHLIITFRQNETSDSRVCMAHPMIAQHCVELMAEAGVTRSDTARNLLTRLCREEVPPCFLGFVKDMLTKRERREDPTGNQEIKEERFSRLILDIQNEEDSRQSASVLKVASKKFYQNPFFPQALARVYYIELKKYVVAENWAEEAKKRAPQNSFVADTLGQIHKNHLKNIAYHAKTRDILRLAKKAIEAFRHEEQLAENDLEPDMRGDGKTKVSHVFNTRGQFGYVQVCNLLYDLLVRQNETWARILTRNVSMGSALQSLGDNKLYRYNDLIKSLRDDIERKCEFFDKYLTYSKPDMNGKGDATYISTDTSDCYRKYVGHAKGKCQSHIQRLKQKQAGTSAALVSCLGRENIELDLKEITTWWKKICSREPSLTALVNYFLAHIMLLNKGGNFPSNGRYFTLLSEKMPLSITEEPELHMLALLLHWPTDSGNSVHDLSQLVDNLNFSYEWAFKSYFRSRYLCPLFFIGKGQGLRRIVHTKVVQDEAVQDWSQWGDERIFQHPNVQERLLRVEGVVRAYRVYATIGGTEIEVNANLRNGLWRPRQVTFYLGFTIKGPVAFDLQTETEGFNQHNAELAQL